MIVLDTHVWLWWTSDPQKLSATARREIDAATSIGVSIISCWEVAMLVHKGRLKLDRETLIWIRRALAKPKVQLLPLTPEITVFSAEYGDSLHGDPADRMIVATAQLSKAGLVTADERIKGCGLCKTIW